MKRKLNRTQQSRWNIGVALGLLLLGVGVVLSQRSQQQGSVTRSVFSASQEKQGQYTLLLQTARPVVEVNGGETLVTVAVRDSEGNSLPNVSVQFTAQLGTLSSQSVQTNADGIASITFSAGAQPGQAVLQAMPRTVLTK